jgi:hypothetical protein
MEIEFHKSSYTKCYQGTVSVDSGDDAGHTIDYDFILIEDNYTDISIAWLDTPPYDYEYMKEQIMKHWNTQQIYGENKA